MKSFFVAVSSIVALSSTAIPAIAADNSHMGHESGMSQKSGESMTRMSEGTVKKVDKTANKITIAHGPLENLNMPGMTMAFAVKDKSMLTQVKSGDKVRFVANDVNGELTVTHLESSK